MTFKIIGTADLDKLYCSGSFTKLLTTFVGLSLLAEKYPLGQILDEEGFLDRICINSASRAFLTHFQKLIGSSFTIRDLCTFYSGLPYTFDVSAAEIAAVELGYPFKHHSILEESTFLQMCQHHITPVYPNRCKFHYSELAIIFLGYLLEKIYAVDIESLYQHYIIKKFNLRASVFSRTRPEGFVCQDLSNQYDYPSIAIVDHGFFCYSNGFYTTLRDMQILLENLLTQPVFQYMVDIKHARAASNRLMNGLTVEIRLVGDDIIYGYEGLSCNGCNIWAYSTKYQQGYLTFSQSEEEAYQILYSQWGYDVFDKVPEYTQTFYKKYMQEYINNMSDKAVPPIFQGTYQRVRINDSLLTTSFLVADHFMQIRNPDEIRYDITNLDDVYRIICKDQIHGAKVGLVQAESGQPYMYYDGTLYKKL